MKFLFYLPSFNMGGAERQALHLARFFLQQGHSVTVWSCLPREESGPVQQECARFGIACAAHRFLWPCRKSSLLRDSWRLLRALWREKPDVILSYCTSPNVGMGLVWKLSPAKFCLWGQRNTDDLRGDWLERRAYRQVSGVICNAAHEIEYLQQTLGSARAPVTVIHNGLNPAPTVRSRDEWRQQLNVEPDAILAVMLANFRPQKDHATLLQAWQTLLQSRDGIQPRKAVLVLAGAAQSTFSEVQQQVEALKLQDSVRFAGQVQDVSGLLQASDFGLLISHHEGLSNSVLEYMAAGLPVLLSDLPANREILGEYDPEVLCLPKNPQDLAEKMLHLFSDEELRRKKAARNRLRIEKEFSVQNLGEKTLSFIDDLRTANQGNIKTPS